MTMMMTRLPLCLLLFLLCRSVAAFQYRRYAATSSHRWQQKKPRFASASYDNEEPPITRETPLFPWLVDQFCLPSDMYDNPGEREKWLNSKEFAVARELAEKELTQDLNLKNFSDLAAHYRATDEKLPESLEADVLRLSFPRLSECLRRIYDSKSIEEILNGQIISMDPLETEVILARMHHVSDVVPVDMDQPPTERSGQRDINLVMGPIGSGKTVFAIMDLAPYRSDDKLVVVVYANLKTTPAPLFEMIKEREYSDFITNVRASLCRHLTVSELKRPLEMRVSLVIDEFGFDVETWQWAENYDNLVQLYDALVEGELASDIRLIYSGEILTAYRTEDTKIFRMTPWNEDQWRQVAENFRG